jgi:hypothetical protein
MKTAFPNCGGTLFDISNNKLPLWERTKCEFCKAVVEVSDTIGSPAKVKLISVSIDDETATISSTLSFAHIIADRAKHDCVAGVPESWGTMHCGETNPLSKF